MTLTTQELALLLYLGKGLTYRQIGRTHNLSESRIKSIYASIRKKTNSNSNTDLAVKAMLAGIIDCKGLYEEKTS